MKSSKLMLGDPDDPFDDDVTEITITGGVVTVGALESATFEGGVVRVRIALDGDDGPLQAYVLNPDNPDLNGYARFIQQESSLNRSYAALAGGSESEEVIAVVAMDGGQFNRFFGGATVVQSSFARPTDDGFVYYEGAYAGLLNFDGDVVPVAGVPDSLQPRSPNTVAGRAYLIADFSDNDVEGVVFERNTSVFLAPTDAAPTVVTLKDLVLVNGTINADGTFAGRTEFDNLDGAGSYSGAFGGTGATTAAGIIALSGDFVRGATVPGSEVLVTFDTLSDFDNAQEYGVFVIGQCPSGALSCFAP